MSRIECRFDTLKQQGKKALIPYITAGDPSPEITVALMHRLVAAGADILELGVPFSDPMADGQVIQKACERALKAGTTLPRVLAMVKEFRQQDLDTPVVLMGYLNPIESMGYQCFAKEAAAHGVDGVLTVDVPPEEAKLLLEAYTDHQLEPIFLLAPTSTPKRIEQVCKLAKGFIYYVSLKGVTGSNALDIKEVGERVASIRHYTSIPVGVGFGIHDPHSAAQIATVADAAVVGTALIKYIEQYQNDSEKILEEVSAVLHAMRVEIDKVTL
ncbi:tryptophan synthase subunit alpha [Candidatus Nitrosacidococcus sp. I8]|uniref:tryptophan synthase subunit alpha n=1 Tax=Candidatus Nitrosacidococcus sp. I8 TaxID=2942908 RepID=UPI0022279EC1|nr:tryptophan synthase subunit alpha [Candidatus Nitrosacidococcus sp. I8]CAH9018741.1 Tryptophan synthase alpha chain [Candidatus Nitrosacidococcus sp. I8]